VTAVADRKVRIRRVLRDGQFRSMAEIAEAIDEPVGATRYAVSLMPEVNRYGRGIYRLDRDDGLRRAMDEVIRGG